MCPESKGIAGAAVESIRQPNDCVAMRALNCTRLKVTCATHICRGSLWESLQGILEGYGPHRCLLSCSLWSDSCGWLCLCCSYSGQCLGSPEQGGKISVPSVVCHRHMCHIPYHSCLLLVAICHRYEDQCSSFNRPLIHSCVESRGTCRNSLKTSGRAVVRAQDR